MKEQKMMNENLVLKLVDSSSKENEVTGDMMGGDYVYEIPVAGLRIGFVKWPQSRQPDHSVQVVGIGKNVIKVIVHTASRNQEGPYEIHLGEKASSHYCFGEWSYGYTVSLEESSQNVGKSKQRRQ